MLDRILAFGLCCLMCGYGIGFAVGSFFGKEWVVFWFAVSEAVISLICAMFILSSMDNLDGKEATEN